MVDDVATTWGGKITLGRAPANTELLVGNATGGFDLTPYGSIIPPAANIQTLLDGISNTQGSILYRSASEWVALAPGTSGNVLSTNGAGANPSWVAPSPYTPVWTDGVKSADQSRTSSTVLTNATDMSFSVAANTYYSFQFQLLFNIAGAGAGTGGGLNISITCPAGGTLMFGSPGGLYSGATGSGTTYVLVSSTNLIVPLNVMITGYLSNGANAGTLQLQFSQNTSSANAVTMRKGSWFQYRTV